MNSPSVFIISASFTPSTCSLVVEKSFELPPALSASITGVSPKELGAGAGTDIASSRLMLLFKSLIIFFNSVSDVTFNTCPILVLISFNLL